MTDHQILSLAYEKQSRGDSRDLSMIISEVRADVAALYKKPSSSDKVGEIQLLMPDGTFLAKSIMGDGTEVTN